MDHEFIQDCKAKLEKERKVLLEEISQEEKPTEFGDQVKPDLDEEADETEELANQLAVAHDLKTRLDEIDVALAKIENGKYGVCEKCGRNIEREILAIDPESRLCKNCKTGK